MKATLSAPVGVTDQPADVDWPVFVVPGMTLTGLPELSARLPGTSGLTGLLLEPVLEGPVQKTERGGNPNWHSNGDIPSDE